MRGSPGGSPWTGTYRSKTQLSESERKSLEKRSNLDRAGTALHLRRTCRVAQRSPEPIIPDDVQQNDDWLLKLHGSVKNVESIVLTRDEYLGFNAN